jgi:hypothetical protein
MAMKFHKACAAIGIIHIGLGLLIFCWHMIGAADHKENMRRMAN